MVGGGWEEKEVGSLKMVGRALLSHQPRDLEQTRQGSTRVTREAG